jgi:hypothetical protein
MVPTEKLVSYLRQTTSYILTLQQFSITLILTKLAKLLKLSYKRSCSEENVFGDTTPYQLLQLLYKPLKPKKK